MGGLVRWLGAQLDEDEEDARRGYLKAEPLPDYDGWDKSTTVALPPVVAARMLREIDAKRQILALHSDPRGGDPACSSIVYQEPAEECETLRAMTLPYVDRPGYDEARRP